MPRAQGLEPQLQRGEVGLLQQRMAVIANQQAQLKQLKRRVNTLEKQAAAERAQQAQRDREIDELQRKLDALQTRAGPKPAPARSGHR
ncbi:MAG: hypothetical protein C4338_07135 [Rhodanobacteraceae bacterium]